MGVLPGAVEITRLIIAAGRRAAHAPQQTNGGELLVLAAACFRLSTRMLSP